MGMYYEKTVHCPLSLLLPLLKVQMQDKVRFPGFR